MDKKYLKLGHQSLRMQHIEDQWKVIFNEQQRDSIFKPDQYKHHLSTFLLERRAESQHGVTAQRGLQPVSYLLRKLKLDLKMSYNSFVEEFLKEPTKGISLLLSLLAEVHAARKEHIGSTKKSDVSQFKKTLTEENDCLQCIKYCLRVQTAVDILLGDPHSLETIAMCIISSYTKSRVTAIEILTLILSSNPKGFERVLGALTYFRLKLGEPVHFKFLVGMLMSQGNANALFQASCMRFFNTLMRSTPNGNGHVFLQHEVEMAGLDIDLLEKCIVSEGQLYDEMKKEIDEWKYQFINVDRLKEERKSFSIKNTNIQSQIGRLQEKLKILEERNVILEKRIQKLCSQESVRMDGEVKKHPESRIKKPSKVPAAPLLQSKLMHHKRYKGPRSENRLPLLDWTPLRSIQRTIFQGIDTERVYRKVDLRDLETCFKLGPKDLPDLSLKRRQTLNSAKLSGTVLVGGENAMKMAIAFKKIQLSALEIMAAVNEYDVDKLTPEHVSILLPFIRTLSTSDHEILCSANEKLRTKEFILKHKRENMSSLRGLYGEMSEVDKTVYELVHIERLEIKLRLIEFIGSFEQFTNQMRKSMTSIHNLSKAVTSNKKIKKVFEIILAIGNFINYDRRPPIDGFHISSLCKLRGILSHNKDWNLLQYTVYLVQTYFTELQDWHSEIDFRNTIPDSCSRLHVDMKLLTAGMVLLESERKLEPTCSRLQEFFYITFRSYRELKMLLDETLYSYTKVCQLFGEDVNLTEPSVLFGYLRDFAKGFEDAARDKSHIIFRTESPRTELSNPAPIAANMHSNEHPVTVEPSNDMDDMNNKISDIFAGIYESDHSDNSVQGESFLDPYGLVITSEDKRKSSKYHNNSSDQNWLIGQRPAHNYQCNDTETKVSFQVPCESVIDSSPSAKRISEVVCKNEKTKFSSNVDELSESSDSAFGGSDNKHWNDPDRFGNAISYIDVSDINTKGKYGRQSGAKLNEQTEPPTDYSPHNSPNTTINGQHMSISSRNESTADIEELHENDNFHNRLDKKKSIIFV